MKLKAAVLYGNNDIRWDDWPDPVTGPGAVKIRVRAAGICGSDVPRVLHNGAHFYPIVLGHEFAGDIVEVGQGVEGFAVGDTVSGAPLVPCMKCRDCYRGNYSLCKNYTFIGSRIQGAFAEYVVIPATNAVKYDSSIPYAQAAMFEPSTVALHGLLLNNFKGGGTVAVLGGGTIGLFASQWAKIYGARRVVVFDIDESRLNLAKQFGVDAAVNTLGKDYMQEALGYSPGGYDYVFETAGSPVTMRMAFELAGGRSNVCFIGTPHVDLKFSPSEWESMNRKEFTLTGSWMSYSAPFPGEEWELTAHYFATGQLLFHPSLIYKSFPMSRVSEAFKLYENPEQIHGKIILTSEEVNQ